MIVRKAAAERDAGRSEDDVAASVNTTNQHAKPSPRATLATRCSEYCPTAGMSFLHEDMVYTADVMQLLAEVRLRPTLGSDSARHSSRDVLEICNTSTECKPAEDIHCFLMINKPFYRGILAIERDQVNVVSNTAGCNNKLKLVWRCLMIMNKCRVA